MVSKTLVLLGLFAFFLVVSELAGASRTQPGFLVNSKKEIVKPNQQSYGGNGPISYGGGGNNGGLACYRCLARDRNGRCIRCFAHVEEAVQTQPGH